MMGGEIEWGLLQLPGAIATLICWWAIMAEELRDSLGADEEEDV